VKARLINETPRTFAVVLDSGDEAVSAIESWADQEHVGAASVSAIGAFRAAVIGFFAWDSKEYERIPVPEQVEVVSLLGDLALADGKPKLHAHVVLGCRDGSARAGHLLSGEVRPTLEVLVSESPGHLRRVRHHETGLALIDLDEPG